MENTILIYKHTVGIGTKSPQNAKTYLDEYVKRITENIDFSYPKNIKVINHFVIKKNNTNTNIELLYSGAI